MLIMKSLKDYILNEGLFRNIGAEVSEDTIYDWLEKGVPTVRKKSVRRIFQIKDGMIRIHPKMRQIMGGGYWTFSITPDMLVDGHIPGFVKFNPQDPDFTGLIFSINGIAGSKDDWQSLPRRFYQLSIRSNASGLDGLEVDEIRMLILNDLKITDTSEINNVLKNIVHPLESICLDGLHNIKTISKALPTKYLMLFRCSKLKGDWISHIGPDDPYNNIYIDKCKNVDASKVHPKYCMIRIDDDFKYIGD